jgi:tetratricopeptide (TPR) repeat protein
MTEPTQEQIKSLEERLAREPQSPLFARLASYYLTLGREKDALRLCDNGLAHFPFYSTAHLVKGHVLVKLGMKAEAKHEYEVVCELMPKSETAAKFWSSIDLGIPAPTPVAREAEEVAVAEPEPVPEIIAEPAHEEPPPPAPVVSVVEEQQEAAPVTEEQVPSIAEEPLPPEPVAEEPMTVEAQEVPVATEDAFGAPAEAPVAEEPFGAVPEVAPQTEEESQPSTDFGFGETTEEPAQAAEPAVAEESPFDQFAGQPFGTEVTSSQEPSPEAEAETPASAQPEWLDAFSQLQQPAEEGATAPETAPAEEANPFAAFGGEETTAPAEAETYEDYTARVRMELFGTENTMTLEEYLSGSTPAGPEGAAPDEIGDLAEKLKTSQRITPPVINFAEKAGRTSSDVEATSESGFVTPTLAEIYVKQGWYDDAIKAYRTLAANKPDEKEKYQLRIAEIEEMRRSSK